MPDANIKKLSDRALVLAHDALHTKELSDGVVLAHHLIADEIRKRKIEHVPSTDVLHDKVVSMSKVTMKISALDKQMSETEVKAVAEMAMRNGAKFADVHELLTAQGWSLGATPSMENPEDMSGEPDDENESELPFLTPRQNEMYSDLCELVDEMGQFVQDASPDGAHYMMPAENPFRSKGLKCSNCVFYEGGGRCHVVQGSVEAEGLCKLWIIEGLKVKKENEVVAEDFSDWVEKAETYTPPKGVQAEGKRALEWISEGHAGNGFTSVGRTRASQLANGDALTLRTVTRMKSYLGRHQADKQAEGFHVGEKGYPSPGRVAWAAWGGDAAWDWTRSILDRVDKSLIVKSVAEKRFTLGPWYVPNTLDAHNEWTDPEQLQDALWNYVKKADRTIRLQHQPNTKAGEWVEAMTMPFETVVPVLDPSTNSLNKQKFPAGTVFLGVQWEPWAWEMVKKGQIRGYSIGGLAARKKEKLSGIYVDLMQ